MILWMELPGTGISTQGCSCEAVCVLGEARVCLPGPIETNEDANSTTNKETNEEATLIDVGELVGCVCFNKATLGVLVL